MSRVVEIESFQWPRLVHNTFNTSSSQSEGWCTFVAILLLYIMLFFCIVLFDYRVPLLWKSSTVWYFNLFHEACILVHRMWFMTGLFIIMFFLYYPVPRLHWCVSEASCYCKGSEQHFIKHWIGYYYPLELSVFLYYCRYCWYGLLILLGSHIPCK